MNMWIEVLDVVIGWFSTFFNFVFQLWSLFDGYIAVILILLTCYFLINKILLPVFDGHLPEGQNKAEMQRYKQRNQESQKGSGD